MAKTAVAGLDMKLVEIATAYQRSRVLCTAARLGVADALKGGERSVQVIAESCATDAATLHRLLRTLAAMGVVAQPRQDTFVLTEFGEKLRKDAVNSAWPAIIFWADFMADNWSSLTECVCTGRMRSFSSAGNHEALAGGAGRTGDLSRRYGGNFACRILPADRTGLGFF
jgi:Dimerisation domain